MPTAYSTPSAPAALGPYSQVIVHEATKTAYLSGCIPLDPKTGKLVEGGEGDASAPGVIEKQTEQALSNLAAVLQAGGAEKSSVLKTTVFIKNMEHFKRINAVYEKFFEGHKPARSAVEVARLPLDVSVEVEAVAAVVRSPGSA